MRDISCEEITETVARLCIDANYYLGDDVIKALRRARDAEVSPLGRELLDARQATQNQRNKASSHLRSRQFDDQPTTILPTPALGPQAPRSEPQGGPLTPVH